MKKDWTGTPQSTFKNLGASNHVEEEREGHDFYATNPKMGELLLTLESFSKDIWEPACGMNHLSNVFKKAGYNVRSTDLIKRGYEDEIIDFLQYENKWDGDIITNPPYKYALQFVKKSLEIIPKGNKVAMFLKLLFLEGKERKKFFLIHPPKIVYVSSSRIACVKNGDFNINHQSAVAYAWFIWEKGFKGNTIIKWFN